MSRIRRSPSACRRSTRPPLPGAARIASAPIATASVLALTLTLALAAAPQALAQPTVVETEEGQLGLTPASGDQVWGTSFESIRGQAGDIIFGGIRFFSGPVPPPEMQFLTDRFHVPQGQISETFSTTFNNLERHAPASSRIRNAANDGDYVAFSFPVDGAQPQTMDVRLMTFDENGQLQLDIPVVQGLDIPIPDPSLSETGVAVDEQGRVTVAYSELTQSGALVKVRRFDNTGAQIGSEIPITSFGRAATDVALLDPAGNRLIVASSNFFEIRGTVLDVSGPTPTVGPDVPISTTPAQFSNLGPELYFNDDPGTSGYVTWENASAQQGDPINVFARRFDEDGNPIGDDFMVNTTTANAQAQPAVAVSSDGLAVIGWAGDALVPGDELDVFAQVYDANGNPIGGEIRVNTVTQGVQDYPAVRFLPEPDNQGRPQFAVAWRDVGQPDGSQPNGTGTSYKCFSIDGLGDPPAIFADGFESGDTTSWSATQP